MKDQWTGIVTKATLVIRPRDKNTLVGQVKNAEYARVNQQLPNGYKTAFNPEDLKYQAMPISSKPFEILMKNGAIHYLAFEKNTNNDEANMIKGIVSNLQLDTQAEYLIKCKYNQLPENATLNGVYKTMEPSVAGKCETFYDVSPIPEDQIAANAHWVPLPQLKKDNEHYIEVVKSLNHSNCDHRLGYHFGITAQSAAKPGSNKVNDFMAHSTVTRFVLTGKLQNFTIQSAITTNKVVASPALSDNDKAMVVSRVNLTLESVQPYTGPAPTYPEMIQTSLFYQYNQGQSDDKNQVRNYTSSSSSSSSVSLIFKISQFKVC